MRSLMRPYLDGLHLYVNTVNEVKADQGAAKFQLITCLGSEFVDVNVTTGRTFPAGTAGIVGHLSRMYRDSMNTTGEGVFTNQTLVTGYWQGVQAGVPTSPSAASTINSRYNIQNGYCVTKYKNNTNTPIFVEFYWYRPRKDLTNAQSANYNVLPVVSLSQSTMGSGVSSSPADTTYDHINATSSEGTGFLLMTPYHSAQFVETWKIVRKFKVQLQPGQIGQVYTKLPYKGEFSGVYLQTDIRFFRKFSMLLMCKIHGSLTDVAPAGGVDTTTIGPAQLDIVNCYHYKFNRMPSSQTGNALDTTYATLTAPPLNTLSVAVTPVQTTSGTFIVPGTTG